MSVNLSVTSLSTATVHCRPLIDFAERGAKSKIDVLIQCQMNSCVCVCVCLNLLMLTDVSIPSSALVVSSMAVTDAL